MTRITDHVYAVPGLRIGRVYAIESQDGISLIDTSTKGAMAGIGRGLERIGHTLMEVRRILITHAHMDHVGAVADIQAATGAQVYVHALDAAVTAGEAASAVPDPAELPPFHRWMRNRVGPSQFPKATIHRRLQEGDVLDEVLPGLRVVALHGHSPGQVGYYWPEKKLLFGGDVLVRFDRLRLPVWAFTPDMTEAKRSIRKVAGMDIDILCLGHGAPYLHGAGEIVRQFAARMKD